MSDAVPLTPGQLFDLSLLYLTAGQATDGNLSDAERRMLIDRLGRWSPEGYPERIEEVMVHAQSVFRRGLSVEILSAVQAHLGRTLSQPQKRDVLADLTAIVQADGVVYVNERAFVATLAHDWGLPFDESSLR